MSDITDALHMDRDIVEAGEEIARMDPEASGLLAGIMQRNADDAARLDAQIREGVEADRDQWRERALWAEAELDGVRRNIERLMIVPEHHDHDHAGGM